MHICIIEDSYPCEGSEISGGAGWYLKIICKEIIKLGHEITIIKRTVNRPLVDYIDDNGARVLHIHGFMFPYYYMSKIPLLKVFSQSLAYIIRSWKDYKIILLLNQKYNFDILEFTEGGNFWVGFYKKFKYITFLHCSSYTVIKQALNKTIINLYLERIISFIAMRRASVILAPSRAIISIVENEFGKTFKKAIVLPLCVEENNHLPNKTQRNKVIFIFASRNDRLKGGEILIKAINVANKKIRDQAEFIFFGYTPSDRESLPSNIKIKSFFPRNKLLKYYQNCDVALLPSLFDNSPLFIYESMAAGLPVIATNVGGIPELIENGKTGYLFEKNDYKQLAKYIVQMVENSKKRKKMGRNAQNFIYKYANIRKIVNKKLQIYKYVLNNLP
jgi:glycosyltransferase involved in cell wall biosynthesis